MTDIRIEAVEQAQSRVRRAQCRRQAQPNSPRHPLHTTFRATTNRSSAAQSAVVQERARIARDLHDSVLQTLYAIVLKSMQARSLREHDESKEVHRIVEDILQLATSGQAELRGVLTNLRSDWTRSGGLARGLESLAMDMRRRSDVDIRLSLEGEPEIAVSAQEALVSISREALNNVLKHSGADAVDIALTVDTHRVVLAITDNGCGFDTALVRPGHFGLHTMRERAAAAGARLELMSTHGTGTQVRAILQF